MLPKEMLDQTVEQSKLDEAKVWITYFLLCCVKYFGHLDFSSFVLLLLKVYKICVVVGFFLIIKLGSLVFYL